MRSVTCSCCHTSSVKYVRTIFSLLIKEKGTYHKILTIPIAYPKLRTRLSALSDFWYNWVRPHFAELFPNFNFASEKLPSNFTLATVDLVNMIIFDRQPGHNLFKTGSGVLPQFEEAFDKIFFKIFSPIWTNELSLPASQQLIAVLNRFDVNFEDAFFKTYHIPFDIKKFLEDEKWHNYMLNTYQQVIHCGSFFSGSPSPWPGDGVATCHWTGDLKNPLTCDGPLYCKESDAQYWMKKFDGYDYNEKHVMGYIERLKDYIKKNVPNFPPSLSRSIQSVLSTVLNLEGIGHLVFGDLLNAKGAETTLAATPKIVVNSCSCAMYDDSDWMLSVLMHEAVHAMQYERIGYEWTNENMMSYAGSWTKAKALLSMWMEYRAYRFTACVLNEHSCMLSEREFMQQTFFTDEIRRTMYVSSWEEAGMCTQNHDGKIKAPCTDVNSLDWTPFGICDPILNIPLGDPRCTPDLANLP